MKILNLAWKYLRYIDQAVYSLSTLLLSVLAPFFFSVGQSAEVLYLISYLLLFLAGTTAFFVTPILSIHDESNVLVSKIFRIFSALILFVFILTFIVGNILIIKNIFFFYFAYSFCVLELLRRIFIRKNYNNYSFILSVGVLVLILISYFLSNIIHNDFWEILFYFILFLTSIGVYFYFKEIDCNVEISNIFLKNFLRNGIHSLGSFIVMWCATQGVFVVFYGSIDNAIFVEQKLIFSVLGFFNIIMIVQENKYQPLYSKSVAEGNMEILQSYDKHVNHESYILLTFCFLLFFIFYFFNYKFYISFFIFAIYRFLMGISKSKVYFLRAIGRFEFLLISNIVALSVIAVVYFVGGLNYFNFYQIPLYFLIHSLVFLIIVTYFRNRGFYAKHWDI
ncbi:membrane hypothetical protein [Acinetobacter sp. 8I-beige]|uniref:hypothetical protein n=1 Tax=Acinetobacter sp. 8I-beige TaxID=2653125 RepID=UPI0012F27EDC|nr:hypothetical protein [Acinetobacter sp. 8I-beige]VXA81322.1 membrane hypothetical protein [Acinetobacter sp. 8I-beige]